MTTTYRFMIVTQMNETFDKRESSHDRAGDVGVLSPRCCGMSRVLDLGVDHPADKIRMKTRTSVMH